MSINYYADLDKLTQKEFDILYNGKEDDTLRLFHNPSVNLSMDTHKALCGLKMRKEYYQVTSEENVDFYAGLIYGSDPSADNVLLTDLPMSALAKGVLKISAHKKPAQKRTRARKDSVTEENAGKYKIVFPAADNAKELFAEKNATGKSNASPTRAKNKTDDKRKSGDQIPELPHQNKLKNSRSEEGADSPYGADSDRNLFHRYCKLPQGIKNQDTTIDDIAKIFCSSATAEAAVKMVHEKYGEETADAIREKADMLIKFTKGGATK